MSNFIVVLALGTVPLLFQKLIASKYAHAAAEMPPKMDVGFYVLTQIDSPGFLKQMNSGLGLSEEKIESKNGHPFSSNGNAKEARCKRPHS